MRLNRFTKSVIVFVGFLSLLSYYCYNRVVKPYLNLGEVIKPSPETPYYRQTLTIEDMQYSYWTNGVKNPKKILILLPPSSATGDYYAKYAEVLPQNYLIISPDYPGRGATTRIEDFDTAEAIAGRVSVLLKNLVGKKEIIVIGPSFGGMIATKLAERGEQNIQKLFLVATGEFFAQDQQNIFNLIFYPAVVSEKIRLKYLTVLQNANFFANINPANNEDLMEQWLTVLGYKINMDFESKIPAVIIIFDNDNVVQVASYVKLLTIFPNHTIFHLKIEHKTSGFFDGKLLEVIKSGI